MRYVSWDGKDFPVPEIKTMGDNSSAIRDGFVRQRRNLIGISVALFLYKKLGLVIDGINILGNTARIRDPSGVTLLLWLAWAYFFVRYYQYFRDLPDKGSSSAYHTHVHRLARHLAQEKITRSVRAREELAGKTPHVTFKKIDVYRAYTRPWEFSLWELEVEADVAYECEGGVEARSLGKQKLNLSWREMAVPKVKAILHVGLNTHFVTEYYLPFLIALVPVASWIFN